MNTTTVASLSMLLVGIAGFGIGQFYRALRQSVTSEIAAAGIQPAPGIIAEPRPAAQSYWDTADAAAESSAARETAGVGTQPLAGMDWDSAYVRLRYRGWLARADMEPTKRSRVEDVLQSHAQTIQRLGMVWRGDAREDARQRWINELTDALRPELNDAELAEFQRGLTLEEIQRAINDIGADLYRQENPLTVEQIKRLTTVMVESRSPNAQAAPVIELSATDWDAVISKCATFLSTEQLEAIQSLAARSQFMEQFRLLAGYTIRRNIPGL